MFVMRRVLLAAALSLLTLSSARAESVNVLLDWSWLPYHAAFFLAQERGYYREVGLEPHIEQGRGSVTTAMMVGQGGFDIGHLNITNAAAAIAKGVPLKVVAVYQHRTAASFVGIKGKVKLDGPQSLVGLKIGSTPGGSDGLSLAIFRKVNHIPENALDIVSLDAMAKTAALVSGRVDVVSGDVHAYTAIARGAGLDPVAMQLADFGVPLLGFGFAVNQNYLAQHPDVVKRFLAATKKGFADMAADVDGACKLIKSKVEVPGSQAQCVDYASGFIKLITPATDPAWGHQSAAEWEKLIDTLKSVDEIKSDKPVGDYYTDALVP
jgi:NitT/TauT family transport system substrate-binding protein